MTTADGDRSNDIAGHAVQAQEFLSRAHEYLADDDLHQASEKGWGAAAHMGKAVALAQGWQYDRHSHFHQVMNRASQQLGSERLRLLHGRAEVLHVNLYELSAALDREVIAADLKYIEELLQLLAPLAP